ncbi:hypothetical protein [Methylobacterium marchantiae]|uniref:Uncharacterized protein n=1 Tax=Methylobacterium marchantiae TaxID=600331 RepID=A0ABW3WVD1_9HYPH|nr:hypothetical protein AIGOOFII_3293 [Methylobacterium marchantiae]
MTARLATTVLALGLSVAASAASAQSYNAPAGIPAAVAPGGLAGRAAPSNLMEFRDGRSAHAPRRGHEGEITTGSTRRGERGAR